MMNGQSGARIQSGNYSCKKILAPKDIGKTTLTGGKTDCVRVRTPVCVGGGYCTPK